MFTCYFSSVSFFDTKSPICFFLLKRAAKRTWSSFTDLQYVSRGTHTQFIKVQARSNDETKPPVGTEKDTLRSSLTQSFLITYCHNASFTSWKENNWFFSSSVLACFSYTRRNKERKLHWKWFVMQLPPILLKQRVKRRRRSKQFCD